MPGRRAGAIPQGWADPGPQPRPALPPACPPPGVRCSKPRVPELPACQVQDGKGPDGDFARPGLGVALGLGLPSESRPW